MDAYQGRVEAVLIAASEVVPAQMLDDTQRLVEHGEPAEGLLQLAWAITNARAQVPAWIVASLRELTAGLIPPDLLPDDLDDGAM